MISLFGKNGMVMVEAFTFSRTLFAFDFDGTLARIVRAPENAKMSRSTELLLQRLAEVAPVAIVSGRSVADLKKRLGFRPKYLVGNHGLEGLGSRRDSLEKASSVCAGWKESLSRVDWLAGIELEDKAFSLALHYRRSRARGKARSQIESAVSSLRPVPRVIPGKFVFNLLPPGAPHKGAAVQDLMKASGLENLFYVGDDDTDEDVFSLPMSQGQALTVRVGKKRESQATYYIERQSQIDRLLRLLIRFHDSDGENHA